MYNPKSLKAEEFIDHQEILDTLEYADANKNNVALIDEILNKARERKGLSHREASVLLACDIPEKVQELYALAEQIKKDFYGNRIVIFAPLYLSNYCVNGCLYCPYHMKNKHIPRKKLTQEEVEKEVIALQDMGHKRLAIETGEDPVNCPIEYVLDCIHTIYSIKHKNGAIRRVNVNIAATTVENYRKLKEAGIGTYVLFQETYHKESYEHLHPTGPKSNYCYHTEAMDRAMEGGIDDVGLGVLFGLELYRYEFAGLLMHAEHLEAVHGVGPHTISVPRVKHADDIDPDEFDNGIDDDTFLKICACIRVAVPYTGMIMSTRENQSVRERALHLGISQVSGGSRTSVGGYTEEEPHQRGRLHRGGAPPRHRAVRRQRQPHLGRGGGLADGAGVHPLLLHRLLPGGPHRRPLYEPVQERADPELLPPQRPDDAEGVPDGLRRPGDQGHRGEADPGGAGEHSQGEGQGDLQGPPGED